eukprot:gnl/Trimastix_PCT/3005.p2 GENE.gnl/Trimastix_PCT/3005~~gnl/Trimastix_PCT/3005.p2  ORF type:complete len:324 (+),score=93.41 gnl/Trimastix_PCT/3005:67-972(+)
MDAIVSNYTFAIAWLKSISTIELFGVFFALMIFLRMSIEYCMMRPLMRFFASGSLVKKLAAEWTKLLYYIGTTIWAYTILTNVENPWLKDPEQAFTNFPHEFTPEFRLFYMFQFAYYWHLLSFFLFVEERGKRGFWDMFVHHCVTLALVGMSLVLGFFKVGMVIMWLHDFTDVPATLSKLFNLHDWFLGAASTLVVNMIFWFLLRLVYFPYVILKGTIYGGWVHVHKQGQLGLVPYVLFQLFLITLVVLHAYWEYCFGRIIFDSTRDSKCKDRYLSETTVTLENGQTVGESDVPVESKKKA